MRIFRHGELAFTLTSIGSCCKNISYVFFIYTYVYLITAVFHDNKPYCCFEGTRIQQYAIF